MSDKYPFSIEFQGAILALMLRDPSFVVDYRPALNPSYFEEPHYAVICRLGLEYADKYGHSPTLLSMQALLEDYAKRYKMDKVEKENLQDKANRLYNQILNGDSSYVQDRALSFAKNQALKLAVRSSAELLNELQQGAKAPSEVHNRIQRVLTDALSVGESRIIDLGSDLVESYLTLPKLSKDLFLKGRTLRTGLPTLDRIMMGGLGRGEVGVVMGPRKRGKSTVLINFGAATSRLGGIVVHFSNELKKMDVLLYYAARITGLSIPEIMNMDATRMAHYRQAMTNWFSNGGRIIVLYGRPGQLGVDYIRNYLGKLKQVKNVKPDLLIVDYMDRLKKTNENMYVSGGDIMEAFVALGDDFDCGTWTGSQTGRHSVRADFVGGEDASESYRKIADADITIALNQTADMKKNNQLSLYIDSQRRGEDTLWIPCSIDYRTKLLREDTASLKSATESEAHEAQQQAPQDVSEADDALSSYMGT